ncbi:metal-dependent hydrolase [Methanobacterium sp. ACI-7]|uniref:metal-dependent hydrolase n=1 Tax=unclassified Methanobacterium TaxID=2627676 RepID=UPI0039C466B4
MPSYKKHALFSIIIALPFIQDVFYLSLAVIGASIIDMDHHVKKNNLIIMATFGFLLSIILYILKLPFFAGISLIIMAFILYISKHRGFSHSIFGTILFSIFLSFLVLSLYPLINELNVDPKLSLILISLLLSIIVLNKKILLPFLVLSTAGIILMPFPNLSPYFTFLAIFTGCISHIILDLFTPSGIRFLNPISRKKFKKSLGTFLFLLWVFGVLVVYFKDIVF